MVSLRGSCIDPQFKVRKLVTMVTMSSARCTSGLNGREPFEVLLADCHKPCDFSEGQWSKPTAVAKTWVCLLWNDLVKVRTRILLRICCETYNIQKCSSSTLGEQRRINTALWSVISLRLEMNDAVMEGRTMKKHHGQTAPAPPPHWTDSRATFSKIPLQLCCQTGKYRKSFLHMF